MSNLFKKVAAGVSSVAVAASMLVPAATTLAASAGEVYKTTDGTVWFVTKDMQKRPFTSFGAYQSYGFLAGATVKTADSAVTSLPTGAFIAPQDGRIFCATETKGSDVKGECSLITGGEKAAFTSAAVFSGQGYSFGRAFYGDSSFLSKTSNVDSASAAHRAGTLVNNGGTVQMIVAGGLWGVPSMDVFNSWGYSFADVVPANAADKALTQIGVIPARMAGELSPSGTTGGVTPTPAGACDLEGSAGDITVDDLSDYSGEEVGEGESDVPVMAFEVEADIDSDVAITSVKVEFDHTAAAGSDDLEDYASEVKVMLGDEEVGSADVEDFTEGASGVWTKTISLDCAIVKADETEDFTIAIDGNDVIDSNDLNRNWAADVIAVRFEDGDGVTTTEDTDGAGLEKTFTWQSYATATDVELNVSLTEDADDINNSHVIDIDDTDDTKDVEVFAFSLENKGDSDITVNDIPVVITTTGETNESLLLLKATLWQDGEKLASESISAGALPAGGSLVTFEDLDLSIDAGDTADLVVSVDIQDTAGAADNGDTVQVTLNDSVDCDAVTVGVQNCVDLIDAEDTNGDNLASTDLTGSASGEAHAVYDSGIMAKFVSASATRSSVADAAGEFDQGEFKITFSVTAFDGDMRVDKSCVEDQANAAGQGVEYTITNDTKNSTTCVMSSASTDSEDTTDVYEVDEGTTRTFTLTVNASITATGASDDHYAEVALASINWGTATDDTNANYYTFNLDDFKTDSIFLNEF